MLTMSVVLINVECYNYVYYADICYAARRYTNCHGAWRNKLYRAMGLLHKQMLEFKNNLAY
jgi:hypothetical protein